MLEKSTIRAMLLTWDLETKEILITAYRREGLLEVNWGGVDTITPTLPEVIAEDMRAMKAYSGFEHPDLEKAKFANLFQERFRIEARGLVSLACCLEHFPRGMPNEIMINGLFDHNKALQDWLKESTGHDWARERFLFLFEQSFPQNLRAAIRK